MFQGYISQALDTGDPDVKTSAMQAAVEANSYDVLTLNDTAGGTTTLVCADGNLEVGGVALATTFDVAARQPLDSDLTAIAALTTTAYGRNLLTLANQAALQAAVGATGGGTWGSITGTLSSQTDLQTAINGKLGASVTKAELNTAVSDGNVVYVGDALNGTLGATTPASVAATTGAFSGQITNTLNGAASTPPVTLTGTWFTGGTSTTTKPQLLIEPAGTTSTAWATTGTAIGANAASGFAGNLIDMKTNNADRASISSTGSLKLRGPDGTKFLDIQDAFGVVQIINGQMYAQNVVGVSYVLAGRYSIGTNFDTFLERDSAYNASFRNGTNPHSLSIYGTYTDGSNYRRLRLGSTTAGAFSITAEGLGTGASGNTLSFGQSVALTDSSDNFLLSPNNSNCWLGNSATSSATGFCSRNANAHVLLRGWYLMAGASSSNGDVSLSRSAAGEWQMGTTANNALGSLRLTNLTASGVVTTIGGHRIQGSATDFDIVLPNLVEEFVNVKRGATTLFRLQFDGAAAFRGAVRSNAFTWTHTPSDPVSNGFDTCLTRSSAGVLQLGTTASNALGSLLLTNLTASGTIILGTYTVATLPSASSNTRARAFVSDSNLAFNSTNLGSTVTAGGSTLVPVFSNGTNWVIG